MRIDIDIFEALKVAENAAQANCEIKFRLLGRDVVRMNLDVDCIGKIARVEIDFHRVELHNNELFLSRVHRCGLEINQLIRNSAKPEKAVPLPYTEDKTPVIFDMDGSVHYKHPECWCMCDKKCQCGGLLHYQAVHNGFYYKCEKCRKDFHV